MHLLCEMPQPRRTQKEVALSLLTEMPQLRLMPRRGRFVLSEVDAAVQTLAHMISFNADISACEKGTQWEVALNLLSEMPQPRLMPNLISFEWHKRMRGRGPVGGCLERVWEVALSLQR